MFTRRTATVTISAPESFDGLRVSREVGVLAGADDQARVKRLAGQRPCVGRGERDPSAIRAGAAMLTRRRRIARSRRASPSATARAGPCVARDDVPVDLDGDAPAARPEAASSSATSCRACTSSPAVHGQLHIAAVDNAARVPLQPHLAALLSARPVTPPSETRRTHRSLCARPQLRRGAQRSVGPRVEVLAMVKSDAYGHGAVRGHAALVRAGLPHLRGRDARRGCRAPSTARACASRARVAVFGGFLPHEPSGPSRSASKW